MAADDPVRLIDRFGIGKPAGDGSGLGLRGCMVSSRGPADGTGQMEAILVVEDDAALRAGAEARVSSLGYRTSSVANGKAALAALDQTPEIDLLFTDLALPGGMSGIELAKLARERKPALKVLFVSGRTASSIEFVDDLKDGAGFLAKPYRKALVADMLRQLLDDPGG